MPLIRLELPIQSNPASDGHAGATRLINLYAEQVGRDGKEEWVRHAVSGLTLFVDLAAVVSVGTDVLLLEDGTSYFLLEDGSSYLLLEA